MILDCTARAKDTPMNRRLSLLILVMLSGCSVSTEFKAAPAGQSDAVASTTVDPHAAEYSTWAARAENRYPTGATRGDSARLVVILKADTNLALYNVGREELKDAKVWINRRYVRPLESLPPGHGIVLPRGSFFNAFSVSLANDQSPIGTIEVQEGEEIYGVLGPVAEAVP
jgi:hypothetical protein